MGKIKRHCLQSVEKGKDACPPLLFMNGLEDPAKAREGSKSHPKGRGGNQLIPTCR